MNFLVDLITCFPVKEHLTRATGARAAKPLKAQSRLVKGGTVKRFFFSAQTSLPHFKLEWGIGQV